MCKEIYVLLSTRKKDNEKLDKLLEPLIKMKVKVTKGRSGQKVFPRDDLPFLKTDEGSNAYGIDEIKDFVEWERRRMGIIGTATVLKKPESIPST